MRPDVERQKREADRAWDEIIWPSMRAIGWWGASPECFDADKQDSALAKFLDICGGVDKAIKPNGHAELYGVRVHFVSHFDGRDGVCNSWPWLTLRYKTRRGRETEFSKMLATSTSIRLFQAYVAAARRTVTRAFDVPASSVLEAVTARPLDLVEVAGGNVMARCRLEWLVEDRAPVRQYQSIEECHRVNAPSVDNLVAHYGSRGTREYRSPGLF